MSKIVQTSLRRRTVDGAPEHQCNKCRAWKPATREYFNLLESSTDKCQPTCRACRHPIKPSQSSPSPKNTQPSVPKRSTYPGGCEAKSLSQVWMFTRVPVATGKVLVLYGDGGDARMAKKFGWHSDQIIAVDHDFTKLATAHKEGYTCEGDALRAINKYRSELALTILDFCKPINEHEDDLRAVAELRPAGRIFVCVQNAHGEKGENLETRKARAEGCGFNVMAVDQYVGVNGTSMLVMELKLQTAEINDQAA